MVAAKDLEVCDYPVFPPWLCMRADKIIGNINREIPNSTGGDISAGPRSNDVVRGEPVSGP